MGFYLKLKSFFNLTFRSERLTYRSLERSLLSYLDFVVRCGPFKGMKYIGVSNGSVLIPKIAGTYECELHSTFAEILKNRYHYLIDVGSAEGYYAVGFAVANKRNSSFKVYAYDTNPIALQNLTNLAELNGVEELVYLGSIFDHSELKRVGGQEGLIICDIEGGEKDLLDPERMPELLNHDILVEVHDGTGPPVIKDLLFKRFEDTHFINTIQYENGKGFRKRYLSWVSNRAFVAKVLDEGRSLGLAWLYMKRKNNKYF